MWATIGKYALQLGLWCLQNPQKIEQGIADAHKLLDLIHAAKAAKRS